MSLYLPEQRGARRQIVINHIEDFAISLKCETRNDDGWCTIVHVCERNREPHSDVHEETKRVDSAASEDTSAATGTKDDPGPNDDIGDGMLRAVCHHNVVLFELSVGICVAA